MDKADLLALVEQYLDAFAAGTCPLRKASFLKNFLYKKKEKRIHSLRTG